MTNPVDAQQDHGVVLKPPTISGFRFITPLGSGGMSTVYLAEQVSLGRKVAIKLMASHVIASPGARERFLREARAAAAVNHPHVVGIFDVGQADGQFYMILELVTGGDAAQLASQHDGRIPEARALEILIDCARGLEALEEARLVHRDLKPANIFLTRDGKAKLGDLGLARSADGTDRMTGTADLIGTPAFMSPEQASGEKLDVRSDLYSLGATLFALVTGRQPFIANTPIAVAAKALIEPAPDPRTIVPHLSAATADLILQTMAKDPGKRVQTPLAFRTALENALDLLRKHAASAAVDGSGRSFPPAVRPSRRRRLAAPVAIIGAVVGLGLLIAAWKGNPWLSRPAVPTTGPMDASPIPPTGPEAGVSPVRLTKPASGQAEPPVAATNLTPIELPPNPPVGSPPPTVAWAAEQGRDQYGYFATIAIKGVSCTLRWLPPGTSIVGSSEQEPGHIHNEKRSTVTFSRGSWLCATECTQELWTAVMGNNPSQPIAPRLPVNTISLSEAVSFTHALSPLVGNARVRLPSRAEWERACRATATTAYVTGDDPMSLSGYANLCDLDHAQSHPDRRRVLTFSDGFPDLSPVASLRANSWGYYDMHGNVFEFCLGLWTALPEICQDPEIGDDPEKNVGYIRGGAYDSEDVVKTRCAALPYIGRTDKTFDVGFRFLIEQP